MLFDINNQLRFSTRALIIICLAASVTALHVWGFVPHNALDTLANLYSLGQLPGMDHPQYQYITKMPIYNVFSIDLLRSPILNFSIGLLTKFAVLFLIFLILRLFILNDLIIILFIIVLTAGLYIEPTSYQFAIKHPTYFNFRETASLFILVAIWLALTGRWFFSGLFLGACLLIHPGLGLLTPLLLAPTLFFSRTTLPLFKNNTRLMALFKVALPFSAFFFIEFFISGYSHFLSTSLDSFPIQIFSLKIYPDDYFLVHQFSASASYLDGFSPSKLVLALVAVGILFLYTLLLESTFEKQYGLHTLTILFVCTLIIAYYARTSLYLLIFLGFFNIFVFRSFGFIKEHAQNFLKYLRHPLVIFTATITSYLIVSLLIETRFGGLTSGLVPVYYGIDLWLGIYFNTLIASVLLTLIASQIIVFLERKGMPQKINTSYAKNIVVIALILGSLISFWTPDTRNSGHSVPVTLTQTFNGKDIYLSLARNPDKSFFIQTPLPKYIYTESRYIEEIDYEYYKSIRKNIISLNNSILKNEDVDVLSSLETIEIGESHYLNRMKMNALGNYFASKGRMWKAHNYFLAATDKSESHNRVPIFISMTQSSAPSRVPSESYIEALHWIADTIPSGELILNAPHFRMAHQISERNFFFQLDSSFLITPLNDRWAAEFLDRQKSVLGLTMLDVPGFKKTPESHELRYAFLEIDDQDVAEILSIYPEVRYIFTERSHILDLPTIFSNNNFIVYKVRS